LALAGSSVLVSDKVAPADTVTAPSTAMDCMAKEPLSATAIAPE
jgi:hypothetical protein